jgi:hypothetical protein
MPNHDDWERADLYAADAAALRKKINELEAVIDQHARQHTANIMFMDKMHSEGALIVHALDRALQLTEALMSFWPADHPMNPNVSACKQQLDEAMAKIRQRKQ